MPQYRFRLESVLKQRLQQEETAQQELAGLQRQLSTEESQLSMIQGKLDQTFHEMSTRQQSGDTTGSINLYFQFIECLCGNLEVQRNVVKHLAEQCEIKRKGLIQATREKQILEKMDVKQKTVFDKHLANNAQHFLDEVAGRQKKM